MQPIDKIVFGDNQFFGINHMSQEKAQQQAERFRDLAAITSVYDCAIEAGIRAIMLNSNERAGAICDYFRANRKRLPDIAWYPSIPYPHKYANLVAEKGILSALKEVLLGDVSASSLFGLISKGSMAVLGRDEIKAMQMLIDIEMRVFQGLDVRVIFLQNVITDLMLGLEVESVFREYCDYIRKKHKVLPGLITQNLPRLLEFLGRAGIGEVVVCSSFNKIGYLMSPDVDSYVQAAVHNDPARYQLMAMSTLASGAIPAPEAYEFINRQNLQSVVFGASSARNIAETMRLIRLS
jgi:hypothetical protein